MMCKGKKWNWANSKAATADLKFSTRQVLWVGPTLRPLTHLPHLMQNLMQSTIHVWFFFTSSLCSNAVAIIQLTGDVNPAQQGQFHTVSNVANAGFMFFYFFRQMFQVDNSLLGPSCVSSKEQTRKAEKRFLSYTCHSFCLNQVTEKLSFCRLSLCWIWISTNPVWPQLLHLQFFLNRH